MNGCTRQCEDESGNKLDFASYFQVSCIFTTQCVQYNLPFDAVYYQQSIFEQSFPPFLFCLTRSMSPKKRLLMFYDQNRFSKLLMIFSAIHNFSKLFRILALCDSHLLLFFFWNGVTTFSPHYTWCRKKATQLFLTLDPFLETDPRSMTLTFFGGAL